MDYTVSVSVWTPASSPIPSAPPFYQKPWINNSMKQQLEDMDWYKRALYGLRRAIKDAKKTNWSTTTETVTQGACVKEYKK